MTKQHYIHKKWVQALVLVLLLSSCGEKTDTTNLATNSNTGKAGATELINGISVPLEPDPIVNNATLVGIDTNGNGVRDDIERKIAHNATAISTGAASPPTEIIIKNFIGELEYSKALNRYFLHASPTTREQAFAILAESECKKIRRPLIDIESMVFNTPERKAFLDTINNTTLGYFGGELKC